MKRYLLSLISLVVLGLAAAPLSAQQTYTTPAHPPGAFDVQASIPITGTINIDYRTRTNDAKGMTDVYTIRVNVADSVIFHGAVENRPYVKGKWLIGSDQSSWVRYDSLLVDLVNPRNHSQTLNIAKLAGQVSISPANVYDYNDGDGVRIMVYPHGAANGFESRFGGVTKGKPPVHNDSIAQTVLHLSSRKGGTIEVHKYDVMEFDDHVLAGGPIATYPETTVSGKIIYDYDREAWHQSGLHLSYNAHGTRADDVLSGSIRWIEDHKTRRQTGEGHYEFDIRVNEPPPSESAVFGPAQDETSFFSSDSSVPGIVGTMTYRDSFSGPSEDDVSQSAVIIDLHANQLSRVQAMAIAKLVIFDLLVPLNSE